MVVDNDIPLPGTDQSVNPSEPTDMLMTLALLVVGSGIAFWAVFDAGGLVRSRLAEAFDGLTGVNTDGTSDTPLFGSP